MKRSRFIIGCMLGVLLTVGCAVIYAPQLFRSVLRMLPTPEYDTTRESSIHAIVISPSPNDQNEPAIDGTRIVWSEKIEGYWQIILFDLTDNSHHQLTSDPLDHVYPSISGDNVIWWQGERGGPEEVAGINYATQEPLPLPKEQVACPQIGDTGLVWTGPIDIASLTNPVVYFDLKAQESHTLVQGRGAACPSISGTVVVWEESRNENTDIYGYDLTSNVEFPVVVAPGGQEQPQISGNIVVWADSRNGRAPNDHDIYAYDLKGKREFVISARGGDERDPKISGDIVVWTDSVGSNVDVYAYKVSSHTLITIAANEHANGQPDISDMTVVWIQWERPNDRYAHSQIMLGQIPVQP
jgi:TolB protein